MLHAGSELTLEIEKAVAGGRMLARHDGQVVLVSGAIPGERVLARVERTARHLAFARVVEVLKDSPDRRAVSGDPSCGGTVFAHIGYAAQLALKSEIVADAFVRVGRMHVDTPVPVAPSPEAGYRMRARFHVREGRFGFFREGTHALCAPGPTGQLLPDSVTALECLATVLGHEGCSGVAAAELAENVTASDRTIHLEVRDDLTLRKCATVTSVEGITGLTASSIDRSDDRLVYGIPMVVDTLEFPSGRPGGASAAIRLERHTRAFFQGNRYLLSMLVNRVTACVPMGPVVDLYAGVGLFAVSLAALGWPEVVAVEGDRVSAADLHSNAKSFGARLTVAYGSVEDYLRSRRAPVDATVLVDPPRTGLSTDAMAGVLGLHPARIVYVSCDPATLARDARMMVERGYRLRQLEAFDLFPNTAHVESLAVFVR